ncbi:MAG: hypothetical protein WDZ82_02690 [Candidatus Paceibacterota bacterium]
MCKKNSGNRGRSTVFKVVIAVVAALVILVLAWIAWQQWSSDDGSDRSVSVPPPRSEEVGRDDSEIQSLRDQIGLLRRDIQEMRMVTPAQIDAKRDEVERLEVHLNNLREVEAGDGDPVYIEETKRRIEEVSGDLERLQEDLEDLELRKDPAVEQRERIIEALRSGNRLSDRRLSEIIGELKDLSDDQRATTEVARDLREHVRSLVRDQGASLTQVDEVLNQILEELRSDQSSDSTGMRGSAEELVNVLVLEDNNASRRIQNVPVEDLLPVEGDPEVYEMIYNGNSLRVIRSREVYRQERSDPIYVSLDHYGLEGRFDGRHVFPYRGGVYYQLDTGGSKTTQYHYVQQQNR